MSFDAGLKAHLAGGATTVCHAWAIVRRDGGTLGFTDHDRDLSFDGLEFRADSGLSALALQQGTGLSVDNSEALGALTSAALTEAEIDAGRFDGAEVRAWLVNWASVGERQLMFRGTIGEITRAANGFRAELRGLAEGLNQPSGRVYQKGCGAVLGDAACGIDLSLPEYLAEAAVLEVEGGRLVLPALAQAEGWFERGRLLVLDGAAEGLVGAVKRDLVVEAGRELHLWQTLRAPLAVGDRVRVTAGCDRRFHTCGVKFHNALNFQGFPDIPGDDWMTVVPAASGQSTGGSRR
ncbi:DUF2163 domain-containing protein [Pseudooceanicola sp. C21-150M6]|uniref:DUF2163 domain-containing protein n=1 Tax=Pseudooceanicola sp. C21-150M6 TaxID=3434355 RepID=UPI003D7FB5E5